MTIHFHITAAQTQLNSVIMGKPKIIQLALIGLLAQGHLLIEDQPGVGKTLLATSLAYCLGLQTARIQFTSDLMPSDITGMQIYRKDCEQFEFRQGPLFNQVLLADEINRAPSKSQSALLQAMEERIVSIDGNQYTLPQPFFVIATQNPLSQIGTFPLPESQLDRFLMRLSIGLPNANAERRLLAGVSPREYLLSLRPHCDTAIVIAAQTEVANTHLSDTVLDYLQQLIAATRNHLGLSQGLSPRGAQALAVSSKACAWLEGRDYVTLDDVQTVWTAVTAHRVTTKNSIHLDEITICQNILNDTPLS
jgi:MoxR-like ATPase